MLSKKRAERRMRYHTPPFWVSEHAVFFLTINCQIRGVNHLANDHVASSLINAWLFYRDQQKCSPLMILVMHDHLHILISFSWDKGAGMPALVKSWKSYTAKQCGIRWQRDFFDHRIRNKEDFSQKWDYITINPVNAGFVSTPEQWPYRWISPFAATSEYE